MKKILLLFTIITSIKCFSQVVKTPENPLSQNDSLQSLIEERKFDPFDSMTIIKAKEAAIAYDSAMSTHSFLWAKAIHYRSQKINSTTLYLSFIPKYVLSIDNSSLIKIIFSNGKVKEYKNESNYQVYNTSEPAHMFFTIPVEDLLMTSEIKAVRIEYTNGRSDYVINNPAMIKKMREAIEK